MAEIEEQPRLQSVQARIAALNLGQVGRGAGEIVHNETYPEVPKRPLLDQRSKTTNLPIQRPSTFSGSNGIGNEPDGPSKGAVLPPPVIIRNGQSTNPSTKPTPPPRLPSRKTSIQTQISPALPPRRPSTQLSKRDSNESISSVISGVSTLSALSNGTARTSGSRAPSNEGSRVKAPAYDPSALPPLPPKRTQQEKDKDLARIPLKGRKSSPSVTTREIKSRSPPRPALPQRPPARDRSTDSSRKLPPIDPPPMPARALPLPISNGTHDTLQPSTTTNGSRSATTPPPIPLSSRPDLSKLLSTKPKLPSTPPSAPSTTPSCLKCRDFTHPDTHATKFPRQTVSSLSTLATHLTAPFPSPTDKARAIFTWLHHNIAYNTTAFFARNIQPSTPASTLASTLASGLAVCEGYAALFHALATYAGLESVVVSGYGKGYGISMSLPRGALVPPMESNHAWNAVRVDGGQWKLIDTCWGAGHITGKDSPYVKGFKPQQFTNDHDVFGETHFPSDAAFFFRADGAVPRWENWICGDQGGELVQVYSDVAPQEGLREASFLPKYKRISVGGTAQNEGMVRFQFERVCPHWNPLVQGPGEPFIYILTVDVGPGGQVGDYLPFDTDGFFWWVDVEPRRLGRAGGTVSIYTVDTIDGKGGRGVTKQEYLRRKGRSGMGFKAVAAWDLV